MTLYLNSPDTHPPNDCHLSEWLMYRAWCWSPLTTVGNKQRSTDLSFTLKYFPWLICSKSWASQIFRKFSGSCSTFDRCTKLVLAGVEAIGFPFKSIFISLLNLLQFLKVPILGCRGKPAGQPYLGGQIVRQQGVILKSDCRWRCSSHTKIIMCLQISTGNLKIK